ncbi:MAG: hypothetical protein AB1798_16115 [Spirochaetota bacterium]
MGGAISVKPVSNKKELKKFILFPWKIYRGAARYENWVPPLLVDEKAQFNREKNPFFEYAEMENYLAYKEGEIVGRISAIIDKNFNRYHESKTGFFGFLEAVDDEAVAKALLETAEGWVRARTMNKIIGPINPNTNHILGFHIDDYDHPPIIQMGYNPPYYINLCNKAGYGKEKDLFCYRMDQSLPISDKIRRVTEMVKKREKITLSKIDLKEFQKIVETIRYIWNDAWSGNWGFVPWEKEEFEHLAKDLKLIIKPELVLLAEVDGEPAGFSLPIPDMNQVFIKMNGRLFPFGIFKLLAGKNKVDVIRIAAFGVLQKFRDKGIDAMFVYETYTRGVKLGLKGAEFSWILEDNLDLINLLNNWGAWHYRTYRIFGKNL